MKKPVLAAENSVGGGDSSSYIGLLGFVNEVWKHLGPYKQSMAEAEAVGEEEALDDSAPEKRERRRSSLHARNMHRHQNDLALDYSSSLSAACTLEKNQIS